MDITVIGHICKDSIIPPGDEKPLAPQYGGIIYSIAATSALLGDKGTVHPVFGVGKNDHDDLMNLLSTFPNVSTKGVYPLDGPTNEVTLIHGSGDDPRIECSEHIAEPIQFSRIKPFLNTDGVLVNMVSGSDISLETLDEIRMAVRDARVPIHFDFHSLTLGIQKKGKRFRRPLMDWRRWAFMLQSVQLSNEEATGLSSERYDETTFINQIMPLMVHTLLITRGSHGVTTIVQDEHKHLTRTDIDGVGVEAKDTTGCGDVFGAAYLHEFVSTKDPVASATKANQTAAFHASLPAQNKPRLMFEALSAGVPQTATGNES